MTKPKIQPIDAILRAPAQSCKPCAKVSTNETTESVYQTHRTSLKRYCPDMEIVYTLQYVFGLRVSEALSINAKDISSRGTVVVHGAKGSFDKVLDLPEFYHFFQTCKARNINPFQVYSRWFVYRTYIKLGINYGINYGSLNAVTHQFRYMKARDTMETSQDLALTQRTMGHKNVKSTKHYV